MGCVVRGIILGCPTKAFGKVGLYVDDEEGGLIDRWHGSKGAVRVHASEQRDVIGFWVAVTDGCRSEQDCPDIGDKTIAIDEIAKTQGHKSATRRWAKFSAWCLAQGVSLPAPRLFFAETEVG